MHATYLIVLCVFGYLLVSAGALCVIKRGLLASPKANVIEAELVLEKDVLA